MMKEDDKIKVSVIVPVFNAASYIDRCARSLLMQTLDSVELLFIDDCSSDDSLNLLKSIQSQFPQKKEFIQVLQMKENSGQAAVRALGVKMARGTFIAFCDSDDWVDCHMYERMYNSAKEYDADVVVCDYLRVDGDNQIPYKGALTDSRIQFLKDLVSQQVAGSLCNKIFKRSLFNRDISFPQENMAEDLVLSFQLIWYAENLIYIPAPLYYYFVNPNSTTTVIQNDKVLRRFSSAEKNVQKLTLFLQKNGILVDFKRELDVLRYKQKNLLLPYVKDRSIYLKWKESYQDLNLKALYMRHIPLKSKVRFYLAMLGCFR